MNYTENVIVPERTLLVSLDTGEYDAEESLRELWELAKSGGAEPIATMMQKRPSPETATCVGSGMVEEIRNFCENNEIELIIFDRELTPTQIRNLENATDVRVVDRTMLILDIFAQRAQSRAGKVQVEAAQLKYLLPRLTGKGTALSRLGGGIGTRGPGETKLETDRRHIRRRIEALREQLKKIEVCLLQKRIETVTIIDGWALSRRWKRRGASAVVPDTLLFRARRNIDSGNTKNFYHISSKLKHWLFRQTMMQLKQ